MLINVKYFKKIKYDPNKLHTFRILISKKAYMFIYFKNDKFRNT